MFQWQKKIKRCFFVLLFNLIDSKVFIQCSFINCELIESQNTQAIRINRNIALSRIFINCLSLFFFGKLQSFFFILSKGYNFSRVFLHITFNDYVYCQRLINLLQNNSNWTCATSLTWQFNNLTDKCGNFTNFISQCYYKKYIHSGTYLPVHVIKH